VTSTPVDDAVRAIVETLATIEVLRTSDPSAEEVARAKGQLLRGIAGVFDTTAGTARSLERLVVQERTLTFAGFRDRIAAVTPTAARASISRAWADPSVVVVGDWAVIGKQLSARGLAVVQLHE
jgi:predicted Zn-dependent peptidase